MQRQITKKLQAEFAPDHLEVTDESSQHQGHAGWRAGGGTHFRINITSKAFIGKGQLERHRMIYVALSEELQQGVHALTIRAAAPLN